MKPALKIQFVNGGQPDIQWVKKQSDGIEIYVDRGTGAWQFLAVDTVPHYIDTTTLPATPATWKYKAIYRFNDTHAGLWSDEVSVKVGSAI